MMGVLMLIRLIFWVWNRSFLEGGGSLWAMLGRGWLFDWVASSWVLLPVWGSLLWGARRIAYWLWVGAGALVFALEVIDIGYFPYTHRRSGLELWGTLGFWRDTLPALSKYLTDFALGFLLWGLLVGLWVWIGRYVRELPGVCGPWRGIGWVVSVGLLLIGLRGGIRLKPLSIVDAARADCPACTPFVLNTTFCMLRALEQPPLPPWPEAPSGTEPYPRPFRPSLNFAFAHRHNVVVFILESFSAEYIQQGYTPFLASLLAKGASVRWGFATNSRSAEGVPAILSGLPSWGEEPLLFTPYAAQIRGSLPELLRHWGYETVFFHGGNNGTMLLDSYARQAGFSSYVGRREYPEPDRDYDGTWGIWDGPFLTYVAQRLHKLSEPFFAAVFTLSSHHPYAVPVELRDSFSGGPLPVHRSVQYADWALRQFFAAIDTMAWAKRALFVFTADHTGPSEGPYAPTRSFWVPIGFYLPGREVPTCDTLGSHLDIVPSVLDAVGYPYEAKVWGRSVWDTARVRWAIYKPLPLLLHAVGRGNGLSYVPGQALSGFRWEGAPWVSSPDSVPEGSADFLAYLTGYGAWIQGGYRSPSMGRITSSSTTAPGGK